MAATIRCATLVGFVLVSAACRDSNLPSAPASVSSPSPIQSYEPLPPLTGPSATYVFSGPLSIAVGPWTAVSRYEIYENGAFVMWSGSGLTMIGNYTRDQDNLLFYIGFLAATGAVRGDLLEVRYVLRMQQADFEDAVYTRSQ